MKRPNKKEYLLIENVDASVKRQYYYDLEKYCDWLEFLLKGEGINPNPCEGCTDYCYLNDTCKSNGGCALSGHPLNSDYLIEQYLNCGNYEENSYEWHDLRKDPNDLPTERDWYLAIFRESDTNFILVPRVADYVGKPTPITTKGNWMIIDIYKEAIDYYSDLECIAWKRIEEFKGDDL